ncbi:MAG: Trk family potassium uptake protein [Endomicrobiales bacterium]|nr:Trk family potassium uptake protein [Endomicrobiales bacterium]
MKLKFKDYFIGIVAIFAFIVLLIENCECFYGYRYIFSILNLTVLFVFIIDVVVRIFLGEDRKEYLKNNWFDLIVFLPLIQFVPGLENTSLFVVIRQVVIVVILISRTRKTSKFISLLSLRPTLLMILSFAFAIGAGAILLMLPISTNSGLKMPFVDAVFTATSATCVTGLIVQDTAAYFSRFGQLVILGLIQIGGLGIMTFSVSLALVMKKQVSFKQQVAMQEVLDQDTLENVKGLVYFIFKMTFLIELIGALMLSVLWYGKFKNIFTSLYHGFFHSISAFCNAGFSTFSDSLMQFSGDIGTNIVICALIIAGGVGFMIIRDLYHNIKYRIFGVGSKVIKLKIQSKIVLKISLILIILGAAGIYFFEGSNVFSSFDQTSKIIVSLFQSVTTRTAGFNSCDFSRLSHSTLLFMIILMFIGASPGSTGGGVKTTTFSVIWAAVASGLSGRKNVEMHKRTIPYEVVQKALVVFFLSLAIVSGFSIALMYFEKKVFSDLLFETVSAFGTVGLSTGITGSLTTKGKLLITLLMFIGRLGPLTIVYLFAHFKKPADYEYAEEKVMIG